MSGSSKKKLRKEQQNAALTEKQLKAKKEAKQLKTYTMTFVICMVLVVAIVLGIFLQAPINTIINQNTQAVTIGNHTLTVPMFSYFYVDEINNYYMRLYQQYGQYASYLLGFTPGVSLNKQVFDKETGETWAQFFMSSAAESAQIVYALYDLAVAQGHTLTAEEQATLTSTINELDYTAAQAGYRSVNTYLTAVYGNGATKETFSEYSRISALASSYYNKYSEDLHKSYTAEQLAKFEEDKVGEFYSYTFLSYQITVSNYLGEGTKDESGNVTYTDEQKAEALEKAKADAEKLMGHPIKDAVTFNEILAEIFKQVEESNGNETTDPSDPTIESTDATTEPSADPSETGTTAPTTSGSTTETKLPTCTEADRYLYSQLNATLQEWVKSDKLALDTLTLLEVKTEKAHEHAEGEEHSDDEEKEYEVTGFMVVLMQKVDHNDMKMVNVRHILIEIEDLATDASEEDKALADTVAKTEAEKLLNQFLEGEKTPEKFGELATANTKDPGSVTTGGLYEDVYPGWAVKEFDDWCFDPERKVGDTGIVKTENGYHVMYLESFTERTFREYMIANQILTEDLEKWLEDLKAATPYVEIDLSRMNWDITFGG